MKVLFLTRYAYEGASSRYRVYQYLPFLEEAGIDYMVSPFMSSRMYRRVMNSGASIAKTTLFMSAVASRWAMARKAGRFDLVYMQRECLPFGRPWLERSFRKRGVKTVFDYDDALFIFKKSTHNRVADLFRRPEKYKEIFGLVDCVLAGNDWLRDWASEYCRDARTFHVAEDLSRYTIRPRHKNGAVMIIGWLGSPSTEKYLKLIEPAMLDICSRNPQVVLKIVGGGSYQLDGIRVEHVPWSLETEITDLHTFDIGIMPLPQEEWSKGKSGGKARTYMSAGVPAVCTRIGFNEELIEDGVTGFLVSEQDEWIDALSRLIDHADLRQRVGDAARKHVEEHYSLEKLGPRFVEIIREVAGRA